MTTFIDKSNSLNRIKHEDFITLELGPGERRKYPDSITVDMVDLPEADIVTNFEEGFSFLPDSSIDRIYSSHVLEHMPDLGLMMREINRVLKPGGICEIIVPHFSNPYFYSDYTHKSFWGLYTICYFSKSQYFKRSTPTFYSDLDFNIKKIDLRFYSPFFFRKVIKKIFGLCFNSCKYMQEFYEEIFSPTFPCHEMHIEIEKKPKDRNTLSGGQD